jgi:hypothetical protein
VYINSSGNVGIGAGTSPGEKLEVVGNISASGGITAASFTGSFSGAVTGDATGLTGTPDISVRHITASGNISASGKLQSTGLEFGTFSNFLNFTAGGTSNTFKYNEWKQSASGGTTISNTAGTINFDSKLNADTMVISGSSVGIGTTTPTHKLHIVDGSDSFKYGADIGNGFDGVLLTGDAPGVKFAGPGDDFIIGKITAGVAFFNDTDSNYKMILNDDGNLGIGTGTSSPSEKLHVVGNITSSGKITVGADGNGSDFKVFGEKANTFMQYDASEEQLTIKHPKDQAGLTVFTTSSASPTGGGQIRVGRDGGQYIGLKTLDRDAHFIHRQDETDHGTARTYFEIWDSSYPASGSHHWTFKSADGSGGNLVTRMLISSTTISTFKCPMM